MFKKISLAIIAALFLSVASPAIAAEALILDIGKVFANSKAGQSLIGQIKTRAEALQATRDKAQKELEGDAKKIDEQKTLLTQEALRAKADDLRLKEIAKNQELQQELRKLEASQLTARNEILKALQPILKDVMAEKKASMIMEKRAVLISSPDIDVTDIVVKRLDGVLTSVTLKDPKN